MDHHRMVRRVVFPANSYPAGANRLRLNDDVEAHSHDFVEVAVVLSGTGVYERAAGGRPLSRGTVCAVRPGQWHAYRCCVDLDVFNLYLGPELLGRDLGWTLDQPQLARFLLRGGESTRPIRSNHVEPLVEWLTRLAHHRSLLGEPSAATALGLVCCALAELATAGLDDRADRPAISPVVRRALQLIGDDPAYPWRMKELAARLHISPSHLHRLFGTEVGAAPMAWLARTRAERGAALLIQTELPVGEVGGRVGWPDANYFSRQFRALQGVSPSAYRRRFRLPVT